MPMTTYALFKTIRSHTIDSPSAAKAVSTGRPTACNLCHIDRSLAWTSGWLERWYGAPPANLDPRYAQTSLVLERALRGDAAARVVAAAALGAPFALEISGRDWEAAPLAVLLDDPYSAVRRVAARSLRALGPEYPEVDVLAAADVRARARREILSRVSVVGGPDRRASLLAHGDGSPDEAALEAALAERDGRAITIAE
jgi:hypothetical protein